MNDRAEDDQINRSQFKGRGGGRDFWFWRDKPIGEIGISRTLLDAADVRFEQLRSRPPGEDPPDCEAIIEGEHAAIEVTELVHRPTLETSIRGVEQHYVWSGEDVTAALQDLITRKDRPRLLRGGPYARYFLLIHTDEWFLGTADVERHLQGAFFTAELITDAYLGLSYDPGFKGCPVFRLPLARR